MASSTSSRKAHRNPRNPLACRLRGPLRLRLVAYERVRRRVFSLSQRFALPPSMLAARYGLDPEHVAVALSAAGAKVQARH